MTSTDAALQKATSARAALQDLQAALLQRVATVDAQLVAAIAELKAAAGGTTSPTPTPVPAVAPNVVRIGAASYPLAAVNPTKDSNPAGAPYDGVRGPDQLIVYRAPWTRTGTNAFGAEAEVTAEGRVGTVTVGRAGGIGIPAAPAYVLSGHGKAADWLQANARAGAVVELVHVDEQPPAQAGQPTAAHGRTVAVYLMRGSAGSAALGAAMAAGVNQARVAFLQGTPLQLVDWGGEPVAALAASVARLRAAGGTALVSVGGQDGGVPGDNAALLVSGVRAAEAFVGTRDGWDVDIEAATLNIPATVNAATVLSAGRESTYINSFVPPGGEPVGLYLQAAKQCVAAGLRVQFGQQLYGASGVHISVDQGLGALDLAVRALGDPSRVLIGMWVGPAQEQWTLAECEQILTRALGEWPTLGGVSAWTGGGGEIPAWAQAMRALLGS